MDALAKYDRLVDAIRDEARATRIAHDCHAPGHDIRWCATCDARSDGIDAYREALKRVISGCDKEPDGDALLHETAPTQNKGG